MTDKQTRSVLDIAIDLAAIATEAELIDIRLNDARIARDSKIADAREARDKTNAEADETFAQFEYEARLEYGRVEKQLLGIQTRREELMLQIEQCVLAKFNNNPYLETDPILAKHIDEIFAGSDDVIHARIRRELPKRGIIYVGDLLKCTPDQVANMIEPESLDTLNDVLNSHGLSLA